MCQVGVVLVDVGLIEVGNGAVEPLSGPDQGFPWWMQSFWGDGPPFQGMSGDHDLSGQACRIFFVETCRVGGTPMPVPMPIAMLALDEASGHILEEGLDLLADGGSEEIVFVVNSQHHGQCVEPMVAVADSTVERALASSGGQDDRM